MVIARPGLLGGSSAPPASPRSCPLAGASALILFVLWELGKVIVRARSQEAVEEHPRQAEPVAAGA